MIANQETLTDFHGKEGKKTFIKKKKKKKKNQNKIFFSIIKKKKKKKSFLSFKIFMNSYGKTFYILNFSRKKNCMVKYTQN